MTTLIRLLTDLRTIAKDPEHHHPERLAAIANEAINALTHNIRPHELGHTIPAPRTITIDDTAVHAAAKHASPAAYGAHGPLASRARRRACEDALDMLNAIQTAQRMEQAIDDVDLSHLGHRDVP